MRIEATVITHAVFLHGSPAVLQVQSNITATHRSDLTIAPWNLMFYKD